MRKKPASIFLVALLVILQLFTAVPSALAAGERDVLSLTPPLVQITTSSFKAYDSGGVEVTDYNHIPQSAHIAIQYAFNVLDAALPADEVKAGDYFSITLPSQLTSIASFNPVTNSPLTVVWSGTTYTIGYLSITSAGVATVTFASDIESLSDVSSSFTIEGDLDEPSITEGSPVSFQLWAEGVVITVGFEDDPPELPDATVEKTGSYNPATNEITWTITVNSGDAATTIANVRVVDDLGDRQTFKSSSVAAPNISTNADGDYVFSLGNITGTTSFTVVTTPADSAFGAEGTSQFVTNDAALYVDTFADPIDTASAQVTVTTDWIRKSGAVRNVAGINYIDWTITLNNNNRTIPAGSTVTDTLPSANLAFVPGTVLRNNAAPPSGDTADISGQTLTYTFGNDATGIQTIKFTTQVLDAYYTQQAQTSFANTSSLTIGSTPYSVTSSGVPVGTSLIYKRGRGYDAATQLITWEIEVNRNARDIAGATVTETIGNNQLFNESFGITRRDGSTTINLTRVTDPAQVTSAVNQYYFDSANKKLTIYLGDLTTSAHPYLTFKTQVTNPSHYANNSTVTYYNASAVLVGGGVQLSTVTNASQSVASQVLAKAATSYNYATKTLSWSVTVNQNNMSMPNAVVTELIQSGQAYVAGSLKIGGADPGEKLTIDAAGTTLTVTLGSITQQTVITFDTVVTNLSVFLSTNGDVTFRNNASLSSGITGAPNVSVQAQYVVGNKPVEKRLRQEFVPLNGYIGWEVFVNPNQAPMNGASLSDTLQAGLELDNESVHLYYWNQAANGTMSIGTEVPANLYTYSYNYTTRLFSIALPDGAQGYYLSFNTDVTMAGTYSNTIGLTGTYQVTDGASSTFVVTPSDIAVAGSGRNGSIIVTKTDPSGAPLTSPAVFELLDSSGYIKETLTTDANGQAHFQRLKLRTYYIREKAAPLGYGRDATEYMVTITGDALVQTLSVSNAPLTASIILHKADENGNPLSGGLFQIFSAADTAFVHPLQSAASVEGVIRFTNLERGDYVVREIERPLGYQLWAGDVPISLVVDEATNTLPDTEITEPFVDAQLTASIILHKADENGDPLSGGTFQVYRAADTAFEHPLQSASSVGGVIRFTGLVPGDYVVRETRAPFGYKLWESVIPVSLAVAASTNMLPDAEIAAPIVNAQLTASVILHKADENGRPLSGGTFQVFRASDTAFAHPLQSAASVEGVIRFTGLVPGDYVVREIIPPYGYQLWKDDVEISLVVDADTNTMPDAEIAEPFADERAYGTIELMKIDGNGAPLAGVKFGLYLNGYLIDTAISDSRGYVHFKDVLFGEYTVKELSAPAGYAVSDIAARVRVEDGGLNRTYPYVIVNRLTIEPPVTGDACVPVGAALLIVGMLTLLIARKRGSEPQHPERRRNY